MLVRLRDAATFITELPKKEAAEPEWQTAIETLMRAAERGWPFMLAHIGVLLALNRATFATSSALNMTSRNLSRETS